MTSLDERERLYEIARLLREMVTKARKDNDRLWKENVRLRQACERYGLDVDRILNGGDNA